MSHADYLEACAEAMEARWAFEDALERHRKKNASRGIAEFKFIDEAGASEWATYIRLERIAKDMRPRPAETMPEEDRHPRAHDETWVAKFNEEQRS